MEKRNLGGSRVLNGFFFGTADIRTLHFFRVCLGILLIFYFLFLLPNYTLYFGVEGVTQGISTNLSLFKLQKWGVPPLAIGVLGLMAAIGFTVGFWARVSTLVLYLVFHSQILEGFILTNGEDLTARTLLLYSCFLPLGRRKSTDPLPPLWPVRLMQITVCAMYFISLSNKFVADFAWIDGDAMYFILVNDVWSRWPWPQVVAQKWVTVLFTYIGVLVELLVPVYVWNKRWGWLAALVAIAFHILIAILIKNVAFFSLVTATGFILFIPSEKLPRRATEKISGKYSFIS